ncbi:WD40 repeat domain-containing protein [Micromonospora psammae]|uniref:WD40 repeat domain-containing protein n=1 Tax=Micromonospora sp. CPCC 205556 TaxID=3122398 RepID=UPI003FA5747E
MTASDGSWLTSGGQDGTVRVWDPASGTLRHTLTDQTGRVEALVAAPDGSWLTSGGPDGTVQIWDPIIGTLRRSLAGHGGWVPLHSGCSSKQERHQRAYRSASAMDVFEQPGMPLDEPGEAVVDHRVEHGPRLSLQGVAVLGRDLVQAGLPRNGFPLAARARGPQKLNLSEPLRPTTRVKPLAGRRCSSPSGRCRGIRSR